ncbi:MAG: class I SAM-dependent methyltransferase [Nitrospinota bacterium]
MDELERYKYNRLLVPMPEGMLVEWARECGLQRRSEVLEVACGKGWASLVLAEHLGCTVTGMDPSEAFVEEARRLALFRDQEHLVNFIQAEGGALPFDEGFFDLALSLGPYHQAELREALAELCRVVRPGGHLLLGDALRLRGELPEAVENLWVEEAERDDLRRYEDYLYFLGGKGLRVVRSQVISEETWEDFYAPQARVVWEDRQRFPEDEALQRMLDEWEEEIELFRDGGGRESVGYGVFLLRVEEGEGP